MKDIETPWIIAGIIIPDIPWILQRALYTLDIFDIYDLRLYVTIQASLISCLVLSAALSFFSKKPLQVFFVLALNSLIHLLLDAMQIKWGNGVHLLSPFSWSLFEVGIFWPEDIFSYILTGAGLVYLLVAWKSIIARGVQLVMPSRSHLVCVTFCCLLYVLAPFSLMNELEESNATSVQTLRNPSLRPGRAIALDRVLYSHPKKAAILYSGEAIELQGNIPKETTKISLQGSFLTERTIVSSKFHIHNSFRDKASYIGLLLSSALWIFSLLPFSRKNTFQGFDS